MVHDDKYDMIIAGGGTSGAALAGILTRDTSLSILLLPAATIAEHLVPVIAVGQR